MGEGPFILHDPLNIISPDISSFTQALLKNCTGIKYARKKDNKTRLIYNDVKAIKFILFTLVVLILLCFGYLGLGVEIVLFLVSLSFAFFFFFFYGTPILKKMYGTPIGVVFTYLL